MSLSKKIKGWVDQNLLTATQAEKILQFETTHHGDKTLRSVLLLGCIVVAIGLVAVIAANWDAIPPLTKLTVDFILLGSVAFLLYQFYHKENALLFDGLLAFYIIFVLASIGLISQIYQMGGNWIDAVKLWFFIILPASLFTRSQLVAHILVVGLLIVAGDFLYDAIHPLGLHDRVLFNSDLIVLPALVGILSGVISLGNILAPFKKAFASWLGLLFFYGTVFADFLIGSREWAGAFAYPTFLIVIFGLLAILWLGMLLLPRLPWTFKERLLAFFMTLVYAIMLIPAIQQTDSEILGAALLLLAWGFLALFFVITHQPKLFEMMMVLIGIRFLVIYFQVFESLAKTGVGLIVAGLLIVGTTFLWIKYRKKFFQLVGA